MPQLLRDIQVALLKALYDEQSGKLVALLVRLEAKTNIRREQIVYGFGGLFGVYMIFGYFAQLVCNTIGLAYPVYASVKAIRTEDKDDDKQWLTYWTVLAVFSLFDFFSEKVMGVFPLYWMLKCAFLLYLYLPQFRGAEHLYRDVVDPGVSKLEAICPSTGQLAVARRPTSGPAPTSTSTFVALASTDSFLTVRL
uniref:Receptor expression-enhancing protein n=1 Tax=Plectus sambesii TaxID=2011161 RepID=A0A914XB16_9BILA